jgi:hypothetical protein
MNCEAQKGFLTLSHCENPAATACANCARSLCPAHLAPPTFTMCYDCAATAGQSQQQQPSEREDEYDESWAHDYRSSYRNDTGYVAGSTTYYDSQDTRSFDEREGDDFGDETVRDGFAES